MGEVLSRFRGHAFRFPISAFNFQLSAFPLPLSVLFDALIPVNLYVLGRTSGGNNVQASIIVQISEA